MSSTRLLASPKSIWVLSLKKSGFWTPAYPVAMDRLKAMTSVASQTWRTGMPADRRPRLIDGGRVDGVVGADDEDDVGGGEVLVDLVHLLDDVVRHLRLREEDVHVPREAAGDGVDAEPDVDASASEDLGEARRRRAAPARSPCRTPV